MITLYVTQPKKELYDIPYTGRDKKEALLKIIEAHAPNAFAFAGIKFNMSYEEIETRLADDYLMEYDKPMYPEYFDVFIKQKGKMRKLF